MHFFSLFARMNPWQRAILRFALTAFVFSHANAHQSTESQLPLSLQTGIATIKLLHSPREPDAKQARDPYHDLRSELTTYFQTTRITADAANSLSPLNPDAVWQWPADRFEPIAPGQKTPSPAEQPFKRIALAEGETQISRLRIQLPPGNDHLHLSFELARLDFVQIAWRTNGDPWRIETAGDRVPQHEWPVAGRYPTFDIDIHGGELDLLVKIAHAGVLQMPITLKDHNAILAERTASVMLTSLAIGINFVLALVAAGAAVVFRRVAFFSVTMMLGLMAITVFASSGLLGMYAFDHSASFNDEIKLFLSALWAASLPGMAMLAYAGLWRNRAMGYAALAFLLGWMAFITLNIEPIQRNQLNAAIVPLVVSSLAAVMLIALAAWQHLRQKLPLLLTLSLLLAASSLLVPLLSLRGWIMANMAVVISGYICIAVGLLMLRALVSQYQFGRMATLRAEQTTGRDALTGLLSHDSMALAVRKLSAELYQEGTHAVFMQIDLGNTDALRQRFGDEGFERGLLQVAAALTISHGGWENLSRAGPAALAMTAILPPQPDAANERAQKILTRLIFLADHGTPLAAHARIALAWMPSAGVLLPQLIQQCDATLRELAIGKRIAWVGGSQAHENLMPVAGESLAALIKSQMQDRLHEKAQYRLSQGRPSAPAGSQIDTAAAIKDGILQPSPSQPLASSIDLDLSPISGGLDIDAFIKRIEQRLRSDSHYRFQPSSQ